MRRTVALSVLCALASHAGADDLGTDFGPQARALYRVAACGGTRPCRAVPRPGDHVALHVDVELYASYRRAWADKAGAFIATLRPKAAPTTIVYPFGGGDLTSALVVFPDATEITTISLEAPGDVRAIDTIKSRSSASTWGRSAATSVGCIAPRTRRPRACRPPRTPSSPAR